MGRNARLTCEAAGLSLLKTRVGTVGALSGNLTPASTKSAVTLGRAGVAPRLPFPAPRQRIKSAAAGRGLQSNGLTSFGAAL